MQAGNPRRPRGPPTHVPVPSRVGHPTAGRPPHHPPPRPPPPPHLRQRQGSFVITSNNPARRMPGPRRMVSRALHPMPGMMGARFNQNMAAVQQRRSMHTESHGLDILRSIGDTSSMMTGGDQSGFRGGVNTDSKLINAHHVRVEMLKRLGFPYTKMDRSCDLLFEAMAKHFFDVIFHDSRQFAMQRGSRTVSFADFRRSLLKHKVLPLHRQSSSIVKDQSRGRIKGTDKEADRIHNQRVKHAQKMRQRLDKQRL